MQETFQAAGSFLGGRAEKAKANSEAALAERQAKDVDLQALQSSEAHRAALRGALSTIEARRASAGVGMDTPSAVAIGNAIRRESQRAESIDRVGYGNQRTSLLTTAAMKRAYGKSAATLGLLNAGASLAGGGERVAKTLMAGG